MIDNNLDFEVALYPYELVTYGETGQVCQNWMQYRLIKKYLEVLTGRADPGGRCPAIPLGLFRSHKMRPPGDHHQRPDGGHVRQPWTTCNRAAAMGVANYGQMTAGGWMYIGPQGIVHGTFNTLLNAGRLNAGHSRTTGNLAGRLFVSSGLGGMSGAQGKAAEIAGAVAIIAEVDDLPDRDPLRARAGSARSRDSLPRGAGHGPGRSMDAEGAHAPSPTTATWWICWNTCTGKNIHSGSAFRPDLLPRALRRRLLPARA